MTVDVEAQYGKVKVPALNTGGWYDLFAIGTVHNFLGMKSQAGSPQARKGSMLAMNCCGHSGLQSHAPDQLTWGPNRIDSTLNQRFIDHYVKGVDNGIEREPRVQILVLVPPDTGYEGDSFLLKAGDFPLPDTRWVNYYMRSGSRANTRLGDGTLVTVPPSDVGSSDSFTYNPSDPVPTVGGNGGAGAGLLGGAFDQSAIEMRRDVLVYTSTEVTEDLAIIGPVTVQLWAKSSAYDTDFTAKLVDVHPDGIAHNVLDRLVRARYRKGSKSKPKLIRPGEAYRYDILLGYTATLFKKGHRIRLEISSSNFPHYARNLNTGKSNEETSDLLTATQTILHDSGYLSYVRLPIVPGVKRPH
jgi:uncharacterized protein